MTTTATFSEAVRDRIAAAIAASDTPRESIARLAWLTPEELDAILAAPERLTVTHLDDLAGALRCSMSDLLPPMQESRHDRGCRCAGPTFREAREGSGLALEDVAAYAEITPAMLAAWEAGEYDLNPDPYMLAVESLGMLAGIEPQG